MSANCHSLAILTHSTDGFWQTRYLVELMIPRWESMGFKVVVVTEDTFVPADVALLHVDLSVVPDSYRRLAERYPLVLNGSVLDIRKRRFSQQLLDHQTPYSGKVIVKTDWNVNGWREFRVGVLESPMRTCNGETGHFPGMLESTYHVLPSVWSAISPREDSVQRLPGTPLRGSRNRPGPVLPH